MVGQNVKYSKIVDEDFGALLKYTTNREIRKFQIAITRARINIF